MYVTNNIEGKILFNDSLFSLEIDGASVTSLITPIAQDNTLHTYDLTGIAQCKLGTLFARYSVEGHSSHIIKSVKLTDLTTPANSRTYTLNSGSDLYELPDRVVLGSELVDLSQFSASAGFSVVDDTIMLDNPNDYSTISVYTTPIEDGKFYLVSCTYEGSQSIKFRVSEDSGNWLASGFYKRIVIGSEGNDNLSLQANSNLTTGVISNISVKEIPLALLYQNVSTSDWDNYYFDSSLGDNGGWVSKTELAVNGRFDTASAWNLGTGWSISGGAAIANIAGYVQIYQDDVLEVGKIYIAKILTTVSTSGLLRLLDGSSNVVEDISSGQHTSIFLAAGTALRLISSSSGFIGSIDNVSVREVYLLP